MIVYTPPKPAEAIPLIDLGPSLAGDLEAQIEGLSSTTITSVATRA